ncbi:MAG: hypothetical protein WBJ62_00205 [Coriobacteriia bacterium]
MGEGPEYEVERVSYWRSIEHRRKIGIVAGLAVAVLGVAGMLAVSATREPDGERSAETSRTIIPAEETTETTVTLPSYEETPRAETDAPDTVVTPPPPAAPAAVRAPVVVFRRAGVLSVAVEDGTGERQLAASTAGVYSLSPDGGALAFVDSAAETLIIVDTASGASVAVGPAAQDVPAWSPDSAWLVYTAAGPKVTRVERSGIGPTALFAGSMPTVSVADGTVVGLDTSGKIAVVRGGAISRVSAVGSVTGLATDGSTIYYGTIVPSDGSVTLRAVGIGGGGGRVLVARPVATRSVTFGNLLLSPDGSQLAFAERGDDGYSHLFATPVGGGAAVPLSVRRDCYPVRWTADGGGLLFIEGNAIQGDPTALMRVGPDGGSRRLLADGAGL